MKKSAKVHESALTGKQKNVKLIIDGMMCSACTKKVEETLLKQGGVIKVDVSLKEKTATLIVDESVAETDLKSVVENIGYKVEKIN